jgi:PAS domain S-box-containing protein
MTTRTETIELLAQDNAELRRRLDDADEVIEAIRQGRVDAFVVSEPAQGERVYTMETADRPYRVLVEHMPQGAVTLDESGTILYCNARFAAMMRQPLHKLLGTAMERWLAPAARAAFRRLLEAARTRDASRGETPLQRSDGSVLPVYLAATPSPAGRAAVSLILADLSEHKKMEQVLAADADLRRSEERLRRALEAARAAEEALRQADRHKDEFLAVLAHELRNPLASVELAAEFLDRQSTFRVPAALQARAIINRQVRHMARLIDDLLDVSRVSRGKMLLRFQPVELVALLRETLDNYDSLLQGGCLELKLVLPATPLWVVGDPTPVVSGRGEHSAQRRQVHRGAGLGPRRAGTRSERLLGPAHHSG